jgi:hypothetical protein
MPSLTRAVLALVAELERMKAERLESPPQLVAVAERPRERRDHPGGLNTGG